MPVFSIRAAGNVSVTYRFIQWVSWNWFTYCDDWLHVNIRLENCQRHTSCWIKQFFISVVAKFQSQICQARVRCCHFWSWNHAARTMSDAYGGFTFWFWYWIEWAIWLYFVDVAQPGCELFTLQDNGPQTTFVQQCVIATPLNWGSWEGGVSFLVCSRHPVSLPASEDCRTWIKWANCHQGVGASNAISAMVSWLARFLHYAWLCKQLYYTCCACQQQYAGFIHSHTLWRSKSPKKPEPINSNCEMHSAFRELAFSDEIQWVHDWTSVRLHHHRHDHHHQLLQCQVLSVISAFYWFLLQTFAMCWLFLFVRFLMQR